MTKQPYHKKFYHNHKSINSNILIWLSIIFANIFFTANNFYNNCLAQNNNDENITTRNDVKIQNAETQNVETQNDITPRNYFESGKTFKAVCRIDEIMLVSLKRHNLEPAPVCSDEVFIRRVFLDVTGALPTQQEVRKFLADKSANKRTKIINTLLERDEFVDYCAMKWSDLLRIKAEFPINLWPNGAATYYNWVHDAIRTNMPYDKFAKTLLTANGSNFRDGAANFYRAVPSKDPETLAEFTAQTFLGTRIATWTPQERKNIANFFSRIKYKETSQWKEEIVFWSHIPLDSPEAILPDNSVTKIPDNKDPREVFAEWLTSPKNKNFNQNITNRIWYWLLGFGIVHEPDDFRNDNSPVHPELLDYLCDELVKSKYNLKHIYRIILNSNIYQQSSIPKIPKKQNDRIELFDSYPIRRIEAEVLQDALSQIFDEPVVYQSEVPEPFTRIPSRYRTVVLPDTSVTSSFLEMFGRATRDTGLESDRNNNITESQQLFMLNSTEINNWVKRYAAKLKFNKNRNERKKLLDSIWLAILSRYPTETELKIIENDFLKKNIPSQQKIQDLIWAIINSKEFLCKH
ncbi:MAG: DUF1553 domain-containing protein [Planctomycetaceae bacterium]|jgi:hypothetical protein|nr:DUF1553 domain-containing protein [Planctomycetaceae bacterium]